MCVQRRLACSAGDRPAGVKVRCPVVWIAGWRETKTLKPIDKVSLGEITSHRAVMKVNVEVASKMTRPEGRARNREGEGSMSSRKLTDTAISLRRGGMTSSHRVTSRLYRNCEFATEPVSGRPSKSAIFPAPALGEHRKPGLSATTRRRASSSKAVGHRHQLAKTGSWLTFHKPEVRFNQ